MSSREQSIALGSWWTEWSTQYGVDRVEDAPPEAQTEYHRRAAEIMGLDPDTGARPGVIGRRRRRRE
ncbi:hypothetical protein [Nocardiopsis sp. TNDT3]|uniref:hypothetical protein n=1 Tax=Nocardiopsis sp. TNDT3 TaxID=2249354 RepID=UPI000E3C5C9C|nr:hypothetical protein [Nocardiopsis sp. TNDT3]